MLRRDKWWAHELERRDRWWQEQLDRAHTTIAHLAGKPLPSYEPPAEPEPERELTYALPEQYPEGTWE
jgi:hypothetical protein